MWALVESGSITATYNQPKAIQIGDTKYPKNIFEVWSKSELEAVGIYEVVYDRTNFKDKEYYKNTNETLTFASNTVTASWGTATALDLDTLKTGILAEEAGLKPFENFSFGQDFTLRPETIFLSITNPPPAPEPNIIP